MQIDLRISIKTSQSLGNQPQPLSLSLSQNFVTLCIENNRSTSYLAHNVKISVHGHYCNVKLPKLYALVRGRRTPTSSIQYK